MAKKKSFRDGIFSTLEKIDSPTFNVGFSDIDLWVDMGNFALNRIMGGQFNKGLLFGRNYVFYGESGSGKSLEAAYCCANAQRDQGALIIWIDVEKASDDKIGQQFFLRAGIDMENFMYTSAGTLGEIKKVISEISSHYRNKAKEGTEDLQPVIFVVDSWSAAMTDSQWEQATKGLVKGDMGQLAKQTGDVIKAATHLAGGIPLMVIGVAHVMQSQEMYGPKHKLTGGMKMIYYASGCLMLTKGNLISDDLEDGEKADMYNERKSKMSKEIQKKMAKHQVGITCVAQNIKSRVGKPFEKVYLQIPYESGLDPYSGLFDLMVQESVVINPSVGWYSYVGEDGKEIKFRKADFREHADAVMLSANTDIGDDAAMSMGEDTE